jgi:hypothetical protein
MQLEVVDVAAEGDQPAIAALRRARRAAETTG